MTPTQFFKCLADETRLKSLLLITEHNELCVCELMEALSLSQPKISRHLAQLREFGLLDDRRQGKWVYYRLNPALEQWQFDILQRSLAANREFIRPNETALDQMGQRPQRITACC